MAQLYKVARTSSSACEVSTGCATSLNVQFKTFQELGLPLYHVRSLKGITLIFIQQKCLEQTETNQLFS